MSAVSSGLRQLRKSGSRRSMRSLPWTSASARATAHAVGALRSQGVDDWQRPAGNASLQGPRLPKPVLGPRARRDELAAATGRVKIRR